VVLIDQLQQLHRKIAKFINNLFLGSISLPVLSLWETLDNAVQIFELELYAMMHKEILTNIPVGWSLQLSESHGLCRRLLRKTGNEELLLEAIAIGICCSNFAPIELLEDHISVFGMLQLPAELFPVAGENASAFVDDQDHFC
jgi:hypothetical protein